VNAAPPERQPRTQSPLPLRRLGSSRVFVTEYSFGGAAIGNLFTEVTDDDTQAAVNAAWDGGIRTFDTAPHYGLGRERDIRVALWDALAAAGGLSEAQRTAVFSSTAAGVYRMGGPVRATHGAGGGTWLLPTRRSRRSSR
jgi:D-threo-aldose 1-dehydrogenase